MYIADIFQQLQAMDLTVSPGRNRWIPDENRRNNDVQINEELLI